MPGGRGKITGAEGNTFSTDNQPANRGRKPKGFKGFALYCRQQGYENATAADVEDVFTLLIQLPLMEILAIAGKPTDPKNEHPGMVRLIAKEFTGRRGQEMMKQVLDRAFGTATNRQEIKTDLNINGANEATDAKMAAILKALGK